MFREPNARISPDRFELPDLIFVGFTGNDHERTVEISEEMISKLNPVLQRPILLVATASGMKRHHRSCQSSEKFSSTMSIFAGRIESWSKVGNWETEFFDWARELSRRMRTFFNLDRTAHNLSHAASAQIRFENQIRIVEIGEYEIELGEMRYQFGRQICILGKESRQGRRFNRPDSLRIKAILGERGDLFVAENFDLRTRVRFAQCFERREGENEIANRAAADNQNALQCAGLILRKRAGENRDPVDRRDTMEHAPARVVPRAPVDLVAEQVRHCHPKKTCDDE